MPGILTAVVNDISTPQTADEQSLKSRGQGSGISAKSKAS